MRRFDLPLDLLVLYKDRSGTRSPFWVEVKELSTERPNPHRRSSAARPACWDQYEPNRDRLHWLTPTQRDFVSEYPGPWVVALTAFEVMHFDHWLRFATAP